MPWRRSLRRSLDAPDHRGVAAVPDLPVGCGPMESSMRRKTAIQVIGAAAIVAVLAWECAAVGRVPGPDRAAAFDRLVPGAGDASPTTAVVGARF